MNNTAPTCPEDISTSSTVDKADTMLSDTPGGAKGGIVKCRARGLGQPHISSCLTIPWDCQHGQALKCDLPLCGEKKKEFLWCKVCKCPCAKRNFTAKHSHIRLFAEATISADSAHSTNSRKRPKVQDVGPDGDAASCVTIDDATEDKTSREGDNSLTSTPCFRPRLCVNTSVDKAPSSSMTLSPTEVSAFPSPHSNPNYKDETPLACYLPNEEGDGQGSDDVDFKRFLEYFWGPSSIDCTSSEGLNDDSLGNKSAVSTEVHDGSSSNTIDSPFLPHSSYVQRCSDSESVPNPSVSLFVSEMEATLIQEIRTSPGTMTEKITWIRDIMSWGLHAPTTTRASREEHFLVNHRGERHQDAPQLHMSRMDWSDQSVMDKLTMPDLFH